MRPGDPHILRTPLGLGLNETTRPELVEFGSKNLRGENIRQPQTGEASTRYGFAALTNSGSIPSLGNRLLSDRDTIVRILDDSTSFQGGIVSAYDTKASRWWQLGARISQCLQRLIPVAATGTTSQIEDVAYANGYFCVSWLATKTSSANYSFAAVINATTGALVSGPVQVGTVSTTNGPPLLVVDSTYFILVRADSSANTITASYLDTVNGAAIANGWTAMTDLATDYVHGSGADYAVCSLPHATNHRAAVAYANNSGGTDRLTVKTFNVASGVLQTKTVGTSSTNPIGVDVQGSIGDTLWAAWNESGAAKMIGLNPTTITSVTATTATIITAATQNVTLHILPSSNAGQGRLWSNDSNGTMQSHNRGFQISAGAAAPNGSQGTIYGVRAVTRPFLYQGQSYIHVIVGDTANSQQQVILVDWSDDAATYVRPVGNPSPGLGTVSNKGRQCSCVAGPTAGLFYSGLGILKSSVATAASIVEYDFTSTNRWQPCAHAGTTFLSGAITMALDGRRCAEVGFLCRPRTPTTATSGTGITATTGWRYICVYEEVDARGDWNVSGLSTPSASTGAVANKTVTATTNPLVVSNRIASTSAQTSSLRVAFYRTLDNGGIPPYYRLGTIISDPSSATVDYVDTTTDADLALASKLYAQPGVNGSSQDRRAPPGLGMLVSYNGMLVGATGTTVWSSSQSVDGEAVWFNPVWQVPVPGEGDITALAVMDGTLFVFKRSEIYAIVGDAPSDNAASGGLGNPRRVAAEVGCIESRSVCTTALGIFFQSDRGIELLSRSQTVQWIGQHLQRTLDAYPVVTSATVDPGGETILIECAAGESAGRVTGAGRTLVFDIALNDWISTDRRTSVTGTADAPSQSACAIYTGSAWRYAWLTTGGRVHYEDRTTYLDANGSFVVPLVETAYFNAFQNEQRVYLASILFERYTAAGLKVETAYDYGDYAALDNAVWTEVETTGQRQLEWRIKPRGETVKFRITATAPITPGTGRGVGFFGLSLDVQTKQGPVKGTLRVDPALRR